MLVAIRPSKNVKFISYAVWWIRESLEHAVANFGGADRFPVGSIELCEKSMPL
jgi:DNA-directed RNA polymerase sigma subunit (sigma70/sigma32)